jgi:Inositol monophosphatase family
MDTLIVIRVVTLSRIRYSEVIAPRKFPPVNHHMPPYQTELFAAISAVIRASRLTQRIFTSLQSGQASSAATVTKEDKSPVTIADYGAQAIVNAVLQSKFPLDPIVGEEDSHELRQNHELREKVWKLVSSTLKDLPSGALSEEEGTINTDAEMVDLIDKGNSLGGSKGRNTLSFDCSHEKDSGLSILLTVRRDSLEVVNTRYALL